MYSKCGSGWMLQAIKSFQGIEHSKDLSVVIVEELKAVLFSMEKRELNT